ncbi:MAG: metallophosphoesterase [Prevotella sp.]|nr:metallophosphoesterase [Prevotella sp.]
MKRREFLGGLAAIGCQGLALKAGAALPSSAKNILGMGTDMADEVNRKARFDENAVVIISDTHVNPGGYQPGKFQRVVDDILKMRPLPQNVIALGDMAYLTGKISEYELLREHIRPLEDAGITLTMGMGNHDRRENFAKVFPSYAAKSKMKQFMTFVVETPRANFIVLDSLQEGDDLNGWIGDGKITDEQRQWLDNEMKNCKKPVFVCAHHPLEETNVGASFVGTTACGYIHGHHHKWNTGWTWEKWGSPHIIPTLCIPSTGHWGDIGYTVMRLGKEDAVIELKEYEFFFAEPMKNPADIPDSWKKIVEDNKGQKFHFAYNR